MSMISRLGKSKTARSLLAAGWLATAGASAAYAQSAEKEAIENCDSIFRIKGSRQASYFPGLDLELKPVPGRCFRDDGMVDSIKEHYIKLEKETGHSASNREYVMGPDFFSGLAFHATKIKDGKEYQLSIISCIPIDPRQDADCKAHEEKHAVEFLFPGSAEADEKLGKRFEKKGYRVNFQDFDSQGRSHIAGILRLMELNMPIDDAFLKSVSGRKEAYEKLQGYSFSEAKFWKEDLSSVLGPDGLYKPGRTKR